MDSRKIVFKETAIIAVGVVVCTAVMFGIFALVGKFDKKVLLGGVFGCVLAILNFFFMAVGTSLAADKAVADNVKGGTGIVQISMVVRYIVLAVILFALGKSEICNLLALILPLVFVRPALTMGEFLRKKGEN